MKKTIELIKEIDANLWILYKSYTAEQIREALNEYEKKNTTHHITSSIRKDIDYESFDIMTSEGGNPKNKIILQTKENYKRKE